LTDTATTDPVTQVTDPVDDPSADPEGGPAASGEPEPVRDPEAVLAKNTELKGELDDAKAKLATFETEAEERRVAALTKHEKDIEEAVDSAVTTERESHQADLLKSAVLQRSAGKVIDPEIAVMMIDVEGIAFDDLDAVDEAIDKFLTEKPHLKVTSKRPGIDQGPQGHTPAPESGNDWIRDQIGR
jgi:hypothetical protein